MTRRVLSALAAATLIATTAQAPPAMAAGGTNLASGQTATASSTNGNNGIGNINDGNQATYWESANNAFPQWAQIDLGTARSIDQIKLKLPNDPAWQTRTQTLSVLGSLDGAQFATIVGSAGYVFNPASQNTATITFNATSTRYVRLDITANTGWPAAQVSEFEIYGVSAAGTNLAAGKLFTASGANSQYVASKAGDGDQATYWESANNAFPQWVQVDLGAAVPVNSIVLKLPLGWETRTQTLTVRTSTTESGFADLVAAAAYTFAPGSGNTVTIPFTQTTTRYLRIVISANTGWPAAQLAELEVYGPSTGDTRPPSAPGNLAYSQPASGQIRLTWTAATDNVGVTAYDVYANGTLRSTVSGSTLTYTDSQPDSATVSYHVVARDAAGNQSPASNTVTRTGSSVDTQAPTAPGNLAYTQPASEEIRLTWTAATDNVGVTAYDIYANGSVAATVGGNTLSYTDSQSSTVTVSYYVVARDAAGNQSPASNTVTRTGTNPPSGTNVAIGKPIEASGSIFTFVPSNANDNDVSTYWEGAAGFPATITVKLGANHSITQVVLKLNPDQAWATRTQNIQVLGRDQNAAGFSGLLSAATYTFNPAAQNTVTIPVTATVADVQLRFSSNSGAPSGQLAEFQVVGTPASNPDLLVTAITAAPASPVETDAISLSATVRNAGSAPSAATTVAFALGTTPVGSANLPGLAAGALATVTASIPAQTAGSYQVSAKVDESNTVIETDETNNGFTSPTPLVVQPVPSSDLVAAPIAWSPGSPAGGTPVVFTVVLKNQGTVATGGGAHGITLTLRNATGATVSTLTGFYTGTLAPGASSPAITLGSWTAVNGKYTVRTVVAADPNELAVKQANNTTDTPLFVGRGANLPYDMYEAEDGNLGGGAKLVGPNRTIGDLAGEASGRKAVTLNSTGAYVQWTTRASTNTLVTRFSIPDGTSATLNVYVNGAFHKAISLTSKYSWLYGNEAEPTNSPGAGPRHIYDEANLMLDGTVPAGSTIKLQKDAANSGTFAIDFINLEQVAPLANPDPAKFLTPAGFTHQDVQNALDAARQSTTAVGVFLPAGTYETTGKFMIYGKPVQVVGAGPWYTRFQTPQGQSNTDAGFGVQSSASGSTFRNLSFFGNYVERINGPGKVWGELVNVQNLTIDNVWVEHTVCMYWGVKNSNITITNSRIRDTWADGVNFTNDTTNSHLNNIEARSTGDDSFALFSATDGGGSVGNHDNLFENLSATLTWRAAGLAIYGGYSNTFRNLYFADMLTYSAITISSLDFGYPFVGFGPGSTPTTVENVSLIRSGGHFWGAQAFGALWCFSASKEFRGIRVSDVDIVDPTYSGIMFQTKYNGGPENPVTDTVFNNISISGAQRSGDQFDAKSGIGIWVNEMPEPNQGPAVGSATFNHLTFSNNAENIRNTTTTFTLTINP